MYENCSTKTVAQINFQNRRRASMSESQQLVAAQVEAAPQSCAWKESRLCAGILIITGLLLILAGIATRNTVASTLGAVLVWLTLQFVVLRSSLFVDWQTHL
jgi:hypothetical protein